MTTKHTVTVRRVSTTDPDELGDSTESIVDTIVTGVRFAPEGIQETTDADRPAVIGDASLYGAFPTLDADDTVEHSADCCEDDSFAVGAWQVVGGSKGWGARKVVPVRRMGAS